MWDFPHQSPARPAFGDAAFNGVTPSGVVWNLVSRFTRPGDWVVDPMAGSGTTLDVARHLRRRAIGFDLRPRRSDIHPADARELPLPDSFAHLVFVDPPYGDNLQYSGSLRCLGRMGPGEGSFYQALLELAIEVRRILRPRAVAGFLISDAYQGHRFYAVGFTLFSLLRRHFLPLDVVAVARRGDRSLNPAWEHWSRRANFLLRGFKYLFLCRKEGGR